MGCPQALECRANQKYLSKPQVKTQKLEPEIGHDEPEQPMLNKGLGYTEFAAALVTTREVVGRRPILFSC